MSSTTVFESILILLVAILGLELLASRLRLPPAAALIAGGIALAFVPGFPAISIEPELVFVLFLPPLLADGAYFTAWADFRRNLGGILLLAIGAVVFTTFIVGVVVHWVVPSLPWAACFALGAVVSPPDAVAAKAVLERVALPRRLMVLLEGESLLNDAAGLVLFRFAVAAALTGAFSLGDAVATFCFLAIGGVAVGAALGFVWVKALRLLNDPSLTITAAVLLPWAAYIGGEALHVSGVISTVTSGIMLGWHQHAVFSAQVRLRGNSFWKLLIFLLEALVFILIGLSLREVIERFGGAGDALRTLAIPVAAVVAAVVLSRFVWVIASDALCIWSGRANGRGSPPRWLAASTVVSWAGMRGVVTLAVALSLPEAMPGRDLILAAAFAVIMVTVILQGTTIGLLIRLLHLDAGGENPRHLKHEQAIVRMVTAQHAVVERLSRADGGEQHPRLLEQYGYRVRAAERFAAEAETLASDKQAHFDVVLAAVAAGRAEILRLHRAGMIHDEVLRDLEAELDLQQLAAEVARN